MTPDHQTGRRTVLKTIPATAIGSGLVAGSATASQTGVGRSSTTGDDDADTDVVIEAEHDHATDEHRFELSTTETTAGWTTLQFDNETDHTHFAYLTRLPETAIDAADEADADLLGFYVEHVTKPFQWLMDDIDPRKVPSEDDLSDRYSNLDEDVIFPPWFQDIQPSGGVGLTSGHTTSMTTLNLDAGEYIVECYVKDSTGEFHSYNGMIARLTVTGDSSGGEPTATVDVSLSSAETGEDEAPRGRIDVADTLPAGEQTIAVRFEDQQIYENGVGHDVHLIRFDEHTSVADVNDWMNWTAPDQFISDGTEPGTFLGGTHEVVTPGLLGTSDGEDGDDSNGENGDNSNGENGDDSNGDNAVTAYVHAHLNPGAYALVAEVPNPAEKGLLETFTVKFDERATIDANFGYPTMDAETIPADIEPDREVEMLAAPPGDGRPPLLYFDPAGLNIDTGDIVQFTAVTPDHTVTAFHPKIGPERRIPEAAPPFSSPVLGPGGAWIYQFDEPGVYDMYCGPHFVLGMVMRIVVGDVAEEDVPEYVTSTDGLITRKEFEQLLNQLSDENENCVWPFVLPAEVLGVEALDTMNVQDKGTIPFRTVAEDLGYELDGPSGDGGGDGNDGGGDGDGGNGGNGDGGDDDDNDYQTIPFTN